MTHKIGVIGDKDSVLPFQLFHFDVRMVEDAVVIRRTLDQMAAENYGVIYITEAYAQLAEETIERYEERLLPAIVRIPNHHGSLGIGKRKIQEQVERAVGQNIL